jgi:4-amino-4-deoxy-L-arabinose transferase-like glycosyltransferase
LNKERGTEPGGQTTPLSKSGVWLGRDGKIWVVLFLAAIVFLTASLFHTIKVPWVEDDNFYGALYSQAAHNLLRAGPRATAGVPATLYFGSLPIPPDAYYVHHPVLMPLLVTASVIAFGETEWAVKLAPILCSLLSALFLWLLVSDTIGKRAGALAAAFFVTLPMELHYGDLVDFEPFLVMWMLAALFCLRRWQVGRQIKWAFTAGVCCLCALWTDWPAYLFVSGIALSLLLKREKGARWFAIVLLGMALLSFALFLLQIRHANAGAWRDLWTAVTMRLGTGTQPGSSGTPAGAALHFTFGEWLRRIFQSLGQDYLLVGWLFALAGVVYLIRNSKQPDFRGLGAAVLQMAIPGILYMVLLRNWSFVHDWASFSCIGSIAILGGLGLEAGWTWMDGGSRRQFARAAAGVATLGLFVWLAIAGFARAEEQRSQLLILDGTAHEPSNLIPDVGRYLAKTFPAEATILCNFDPNYSPVSYYAQRTVVTNLGSNAEWKFAVSTTKPRGVGGIVWLDAPSAAEIIELLPKDEIALVEIDGIRFAVWKPAK